MRQQKEITHMSRILPLALAALLLAGMALPAEARPTAHPSGQTSVYDRPYGPFRHLVFTLAAHQEVYVLDCTRHQRYCEIETLDGGRRGWVDGSYLVGSGAKNAVSPPDMLGFDPMDPLDLFARHQ
jgi:hypothetical protein